MHPEKWFRSKTRVGGTKQLHLDKIAELKPDLILANKEENTKAQIEALQKDFKVYVSDIGNLADALKMIREVGELTDRQTQAEKLVRDIQKEFDQMGELPLKGKKVIYLIWQKPYMTVGGDTFIHDMLQRCVLKNCFGAQKRYPEISLADMQKATPDLIFLSSEPFPFKEKHRKEFQTLLPQAKTVLVDGEMFSWYGSRLLKVPGYFKVTR